MKKILFPLLLTFVFAVPAFSQMMDKPMKDCNECNLLKTGMNHMNRMGDMMGMCLANADKIGLTDEQVQKITPIHREMQKKQARFKADLKIAEIEQMEIMEVKDFDIDKASSGVKKIADIKTVHHLDMLKSMKEVRSVLTDEQFNKMKKMMHTKEGLEKPAKAKKHKR
ncbi:MAG: hypothetical protein FD174_2236 [Geobacteraceae bacterium]|nr:MAG: hypothetical protein FD174_2236 [Geobacteraceae bacterium]